MQQKKTARDQGAKSERQEIVAWLYRCMDITDWSPTVFAKKAGVSPSTITRFLNGQVQSMLTTTTLNRLREAAQNRIQERVDAGELDYDESLGLIQRGVVIDNIVKVPEIGQDENAPQLEQWGFPDKFFKSNFSAQPKNLVIVPIETRDLQPDLMMGDRIMVDTSHTEPAPAGIFLIESGSHKIPARIRPATEAGFCRVDMGSGPENVKLKSLKIYGRAVGLWRKM